MFVVTFLSEMTYLYYKPLLNKHLRHTAVQRGRVPPVIIASTPCPEGFPPGFVSGLAFFPLWPPALNLSFDSLTQCNRVHTFWK